MTDPLFAEASIALGTSLALMGDLTGDGMVEALVGAYLAESAEEGDAGKVVIFSYESDCDTDGFSPFGDDCDDTDSANFTGNTEICNYADENCGAVDEGFAQPLTVQSVQDTVDGIGDVDFDGVADIAAGSQLDDNLLGFDTGSVLVFSGVEGSLIRKMTTGSAQDALGISVLALDDVNGDGADVKVNPANEPIDTTLGAGGTQYAVAFGFHW
jgi:hypothetical protein